MVTDPPHVTFDNRQNQPICNLPLYIAVTFLKTSKYTTTKNLQVKVMEGFWNSLACIVYYSFLLLVYALGICQFHEFELTALRPGNPST